MYKHSLVAYAFILMVLLHTPSWSAFIGVSQFGQIVKSRAKHRN